MVWGKLNVHNQRMKLDLYLNPRQYLTPVNSKRSKTQMCNPGWRQENRQCLHDLGAGKDILNRTPFSQEQKAVTQLRKQLTQEEAHTTLCQIHICRGFISRIYKELRNHGVKKKKKERELGEVWGQREGRRTIRKMGLEPEQTILNRIKMAKKCLKLFTVPSYQGKANETNCGIHGTSQNSKDQHTDNKKFWRGCGGKGSPPSLLGGI